MPRLGIPFCKMRIFTALLCGLCLAQGVSQWENSRIVCLTLHLRQSLVVLWTGSRHRNSECFLGIGFMDVSDGLRLPVYDSESTLALQSTVAITFAARRKMSFVSWAWFHSILRASSFLRRTRQMIKHNLEAPENILLYMIIIVLMLAGVEACSLKGLSPKAKLRKTTMQRPYWKDGKEVTVILFELLHSLSCIPHLRNFLVGEASPVHRRQWCSFQSCSAQSLLQ